jgi:hypothetical protein
MNSLKNFIRVIKLNEEKKIKLYERLDWINACMTAVSSPTYDRVGGTTNVKPERIMLLLEKKDRCRRAIKKIENQKASLDLFVSKLTCKEQLVFTQVLWNGNRVSTVARGLKVSITRVYEIARIIDHKWSISLNT